MLLDQRNSLSSREQAIKRHKATQARVRRNRDQGLRFEEEMFSKRSRYLLLHLTANYKPKYRSEVTLNLIREHRDRFFRHIEDYPHPLLQGIQGILWKLEEGGRTGGLHLHFLIFYSSAYRTDVLIAQRLGEYWIEKITRGLGDYWNSNAQKDTLDRWGIGIGQVNRKDDSKRASLQAFIAHYMAKANQVPLHRSDDEKLFGARFFDRASAMGNPLNN